MDHLMTTVNAGATAGRPVRRALADWTIERLYDLIFTGQLAAGADLGEEELSARLDVSRTTVSVALRQLESDGLAVVAAGNGRRVVATFGVADIHELYTIRSSLEELATREATPHMTPEVMSRLHDLQGEMERRSRHRGDPNRRDYGVDFDFHRTIAETSGMRRLITSLEPIWSQSHALLRQVHSVGAYGDAKEDAAAFADHRGIIAAIERGDVDEAVAAVRSHLHTRRDHLVAGVRERGAIT
jgi:DNA-binding GntR family transcriptional regulator